MAIKHVDEERYKICEGIWPDESDQIDAIWLLDVETGKQKFLGYFCIFCRPLSAYLHPKYMSYIVDKAS